MLLEIQVFRDMALLMGKWFPMFQSSVVSSSLGSTDSRRSRPLDSKNEDAAHCHMPEDLNLHIKSEKCFLFVLVGHVSLLKMNCITWDYCTFSVQMQHWTHNRVIQRKLPNWGYDLKSQSKLNAAFNHFKGCVSVSNWGVPFSV